MVKIVGPSEVVIDVDESVARGLLDAGHVQLAGESTEHAPTRTEDPSDEPQQPTTHNDEQQTPDDTEDHTTVEAPAGNAAKPKWVEYALAVGVPEEKLQGLNRDQIRELCDGFVK